MNTRIQFELSEDRVKELEGLMREAGIVTRKDLFNNALTLFEWAVREKKAGRIVASIDENSHRYKELVMPSLASVTSVGEKSQVPVPELIPEKEKSKEAGLVARANAV